MFDVNGWKNATNRNFGKKMCATSSSHSFVFLCRFLVIPCKFLFRWRVFLSLIVVYRRHSMIKRTRATNEIFLRVSVDCCRRRRYFNFISTIKETSNYTHWEYKHISFNTHSTALVNFPFLLLLSTLVFVPQIDDSSQFTFEKLVFQFNFFNEISITLLHIYFTNNEYTPEVELE